MNAITKTTSSPGEIAESVIIKGDLSKLNPQERADYYLRVCESVGLNPLTSPFAYITLNGKLTLYALRNATDQLRTIYKVSVIDLQESERDGVFVVTAKVQNGDGRTDMAKGAVALGGLKGEALANALMKAETKAKRRATLSLCGLGFLDETEIEDIPAAAKRPAAPVSLELAKPSAAVAADPETGEVGPRSLPVPESDGGGSNWIAFGQSYIGAVQSARTIDEADAWADANSDALVQMGEDAPKVYARMVSAVAKHRGSLAEVAA